MESTVSFYIIIISIICLGIFTSSSVCVADRVIFDDQISLNLTNMNLFKCLILLHIMTCVAWVFKSVFTFCPWYFSSLELFCSPFFCDYILIDFFFSRNLSKSEFYCGLLIYAQLLSAQVTDLNYLDSSCPEVKLT